MQNQSKCKSSENRSNCQLTCSGFPNCFEVGVSQTAVKCRAHAQFPPKLLLNNVLNCQKFSLSKPQVKTVAEKIKLYAPHMTRKFTNGHPQRIPACNFISQCYFNNIFLQKSCKFSLQTSMKFEAAKTGSGIGFVRLTTVWVSETGRVCICVTSDCKLTAMTM